MKQILLISIMLIGIIAGCDSVRLAPSESQKQNAWLHNRTTQLAAYSAKAESSSEPLQKLTSLGALQSRAFVSYYGMPKQLPKSETIEQVLNESNWLLADEAAKQPNGWDIAEGALDLGIALAALLGGVYGVRVAGYLKEARTKTNALKEIVAGNELFKKQHSHIADDFKAAHVNQSASTRQVVAQMKG